jgi:hypothetical protein
MDCTKMKKILLIIILASLQSMAIAQSDMFVNQPFKGFPDDYLTHFTENSVIDSLNQLPIKIQFVVKEMLEKSMTDFVQNIKFVKGQIVNLKSESIDSVSPSKNKYFIFLGDTLIVPKYELYFELEDTTIGIIKYCFKLCLDNEGHVVFFDWPREKFNIRVKFVNPQLIKDVAFKHAINKKYKTKTFFSEFRYDENLDVMCWAISFLQKKTGDDKEYSEQYKTIVMDALSLKILDVSDTFIDTFDIVKQ